jgi:hypothetical protein
VKLRGENVAAGQWLGPFTQESMKPADLVAADPAPDAATGVDRFQSACKMR